MEKTIALLLAALAFSGCVAAGEKEAVLMKLESNDLQDGQALPKEFTCDGQSLSPELRWSEFPKETKSFALTVRDPDAPGGTFDHWLVASIPASATSIPKGGHLPEGSKEVANSSGKTSYVGACPPSGTHRYIFKIFALDVESLEAESSQQLLSQIQEHKVAEAEITCTYSRG